MTLKTDYLIVGNHPEFSSESAFREGDTRFEHKTELEDKISGMQVEAQRLGITVMPLRKFVELTGYQVPQGARSTSGFNYESRIPSSSAAGRRESTTRQGEQDEGERRRQVMPQHQITRGCRLRLER